MPTSFRDERTPTGLTMRVADPAVPRHEPLLLLHGFAGGAWYWEPWQHVLAELGYPSFALNLRGHYDSRPVADFGRVSLADYVADAREAAAAIGRPVVIGHSMGGLLAQALAAEQLVEAAVLLCPLPPKGIGFATARLVLRQLRHLPSMLLDRPVSSSPEDLIAMALHRMPASEQQALGRRFAPESGRASREISMGGLAVDHARVRCPVLVVSATDDRFFPPKVGAAVAALYHSPQWVYADHAHFVVMEPGYAAIASDVARWITYTLARPGKQPQYDALWTELQARIGETVPLTFLDGRRVRAEIVNVDLALHQDVIYELREVLEPGEGAMLRPSVGDVVRCSLYDLETEH